MAKTRLDFSANHGWMLPPRKLTVERAEGHPVSTRDFPTNSSGLERMASSYKRLTVKRFPRVQERETAEARYWRNFTNPEVQVI